MCICSDNNFDDNTKIVVDASAHHLHGLNSEDVPMFRDCLMAYSCPPGGRSYYIVVKLPWIILQPHWFLGLPEISRVTLTGVYYELRMIRLLLNLVSRQDRWNGLVIIGWNLLIGIKSSNKVSVNQLIVLEKTIHIKPQYSRHKQSFSLKVYYCNGVCRLYCGGYDSILTTASPIPHHNTSTTNSPHYICRLASKK